MYSILGSMSGANAHYGMAPWSSLNIYCMKINPGVSGIDTLGSHISYLILQTSLSINLIKCNKNLYQSFSTRGPSYAGHDPFTSEAGSGQFCGGPRRPDIGKAHRL